MPAAPLPWNEGERITALLRAAILDTGPEEFFEDAVDSVVAATGASIALVCLIDERRQWFKARRGVTASETPRELSICAHTILGDQPVVVTDARIDGRFADNPLVAAPRGMRAYAGAPIILESGARIGTVCAISETPRDWSDAGIAQIVRCARMVARHIDARRAYIEQDRTRFLELALERAELRHKALTGAISEGMVVQGPSGAIIDSNPAAWSILGLSEDELFGRVSRDPRWRAIKPNGQDFPGEEHPAMVTLRTGRPLNDVLMGIETPDGERRWITISSRPVCRASGRVDQVITVFRRIGVLREPVAAPGASSR